MTMTSYGLDESKREISEIGKHIEEVCLQGYTILKSVFSAQQLQAMREKITGIYQQQEQKIGKDFLKLIEDENICRCPMAYDHDFLSYATESIFMDTAEHFLDDHFILGAQNANISKTKSKHVQSSWHRDLPYLNFTTSQLLAMNFLVAVDDFTIENGGVVVLPFSHQIESLPSDKYIEKNALTVTAKAGDVIVFNSMLIHRAGVNTSGCDRFSLNHFYTRPFFKPQYDYATIISDIPNLSERARQISGATIRTANDDVDWRQIRIERMKT